MENIIIILGGKSMLVTLLFMMAACMILGIGISSVPAYIITATIAAPAFTKFGIPVISTHLFSFYFAVFASLTPPVALTAFTAAKISGGNPVKTGLEAIKLAIAGFIIPFMLIFVPQLLLINTTMLEAIRIVTGAAIGILLIGIAVEGYFFTKINIFIRIISGIGAVCLMHSGIYSGIAGLLVFIIMIFVQTVAARKFKR
jgi:TRAP-type uncharacterized transport system fused permease subunit